MTYFQYIHIQPSIIPQDEVWDDHRYTTPIAGYVYLEIRHGMYGLKEAGVLALANSSKNWNLPDMDPCLSPQASGAIA